MQFTKFLFCYILLDGYVVSAKLGQAPAGKAALGEGIPNSVAYTAFAQCCGYQLQEAFDDFNFFIAATMLAAQTIKLGENDVVVAGGMESMSNAPKYIPSGR